MKRLERLLTTLHGKCVYIQTHDFPDPDAIASAYGLKNLLAYHNIQATICYHGNVDRYNTQKLINLLEINIHELQNLLGVSSGDAVILIDSQAGNSNIRQLSSAGLYCIDHHPIYGDADYVFSDIRPEVGSCSSIIAEYYFENNIPLDIKTATALIYGLKIDTANLSRGAHELDLNMFYHLYIICDHSLLLSLSNSSMQIQDLKAYASAIDSLYTFDDVCFANAGPDCHDALIATIADFFITLARIHLSVVYSIQKEGIKISVRSVPPFYNAGNLCNKALKSIGSGGGHASLAGGFIPFTPDRRKNEKITLEFIQRFKDVIQTITQ